MPRSGRHGSWRQGWALGCSQAFFIPCAFERVEACGGVAFTYRGSAAGMGNTSEVGSLILKVSGSAGVAGGMHSVEGAGARSSSPFSMPL